jgi:DNA-binding transcriptional LysR family regulator
MSLSKHVNWNLLYAFVAVVEAKSISRAAQTLGRGQPAISAALKNLEQQVGYRLAERGPRSFRLTEAGKLLYAEAREICASIDRISAMLKDTGQVLTGNVRVTIASHMTSPIIDRSLSEFHRRYGRATFTISVMNSREMLEAMGARLIHFGIGPIFSKRQDLDYFHIFKEHCGFYCGVGHPFFGRSDLRVSDLEGQGAIAYRSSIDSDTLNSITEMQRAVKLAEPHVGVANNLEEVRRMIIAGLGIGAIPIQIAARDVRDGLLWRVPPYEDIMPIDVYLVTNEKVRPSKTEAAYVSVLKEVVLATPESERVYSGL